MKRSIAFQALTFLVGTLVCFAGVVLPSSAVADGTGGDPPPPFPPTDTTITAPVAPGESPETLVSDEKQSLWEEILSLFII